MDKEKLRKFIGRDKELQAQKEFDTLTPLLQAAFLVGSGAYLERATTDELLELAYDIFDKEDVNRDKFEKTEALEDRVNSLTRHRDRAADHLTRLVEQEADERQIAMARDDVRTFAIALDPLKGLNLIAAEQEIRAGREFNLRSLPPLNVIDQTPIVPIESTPLTDADFRKLLGQDKS